MIGSSNTFRLLSIGAGALMLALAAAPVDAASAKKAKKSRPAADTVTATSIRTLQTVTAPVRAGRWGQEVRLPGGTWIDCKGDCRETLRLQTVDWWERIESMPEPNR